jgi:nickel-dependent lactate racemase
VQPRPVSSIGGAGDILDDGEVRTFVREQLASAGLRDRSVCVLVPDATRACPLPLLVDAVQGALRGVASRVTLLIALGTHAPMTPAQIDAMIGRTPAHDAGMVVRNHEWWDPAALTSVGVIPARRVAEISGGRLREDVDVRLNRAVVDHDVTLIVGPVLPHEVVGFSGGNKYLFPGVAGQEIIDLSHWLGALVTSAEIIGTTGHTPVRDLIDEAAALVPTEVLALCVVTGEAGAALRAVAFGEPRAAWAAAAGVAARTHVRYLPAPVRRVLSLVPERYGDMWTAAKGFYKVEPVVADGGQVVVFAPHVRTFSETHPEIERIGYHCRDYFLGQWADFAGVPRGVIAHSTHLRGSGTWDPVAGERGRVTVTLATGIAEPAVRAAGLDYLDPAAVDRAAWAAEAGTLVVADAGEVLHRLAPPG